MNMQLRLKSYPADGMEAMPENFEAVAGPVPVAGDGQILVEAQFFSVDAALRLILQDSKDFLWRYNLGDLIHCEGVATVVESRSDAYKPGDMVEGAIGLQELAAVDARSVTRVDTELAPPTAWLGGMGVSGLTAYFGLLDECDPKPGETVMVTGAAGAVGSIVGQLAKIRGCRTIGITSSAEKCRWLVDVLGYDVALNYRDADFAAQLEAASPDRIDVIFDNVGGDVLNIGLKRIAMRGRVLICGATSQYVHANMQGPSNYLALGTWRAKLIGYVYLDYAARFGEARRQMADWAAEGKLRFVEDVRPGGIADFPHILRDMFSGSNKGKLVMRLPA